MAKCKALTGSAVKGLRVEFYIIYLDSLNIVSQCKVELDLTLKIVKDYDSY